MNIKTALIGLTITIMTPNVCFAISQSTGDFFHKKYESYEVIMNCTTKGLQLYKAVVGKDTGNRKRDGISFKVDPSVPKECQQSSTKAYGYGYHRGHLQGANTSENSFNAYKETFYMTNVLPMTKELNTGAWHYTDEIIECLRDTGKELIVMGGPIWKGPHSSNVTLRSHGTPIPSGFWKIIKQGEKQIAWIIPNSKTANKNTLPKWESTVEEIQKAVGFEIPADLELYSNYRPDNWYNTSKCDLK